MAIMDTTVISSRELRVATDPAVQACTGGIPGMEHDYRLVQYQAYGRIKSSLRCVFCHAVMCGNPGDMNPCIEPYHHRGDHRTQRGVTWPIGGSRPG